MSALPLDPFRERERQREDVFVPPEQGAFGAMRRAQQSFLDVQERYWRERLRFNRPALGLPIDRRDIGQPSRPIVPEVVSGPTVVPQTALPQKVIRRTPASRTEKLPENRPIPAIPQLLPERKETTMDLGNLVKDLATTYISTRYGQPQQPRPIMAQPVGLPAVIGGGLSRLPSLGGITGGVLGGAMGDLMGGFENFGGAMQGCNNPADVVFRWSPAVQDYVPQKRRKRRRKQLVTQSDIKGLAALKGVVGTGKIMETWIATHA